MLMPLRGSLKGEFLMHGEIFPSDGDVDDWINAPAHRLDESPVGYSSASWSPPELASASPTRFSILQNSLGGREIFIADGARFRAETHKILR
jgi:hypothetical protein